MSIEDRIRRFGFLLLAAEIGIGLALTWRTWPDPIVDFGREWYVPWRMSVGDILYRDIAYFNGPISPYWNSWLFRLLGPTLLTLMVANAGILFLFGCLLRALLRRVTNEATALLTSLLVVGVCGFGIRVTIGNYNWICPYSHEATHGLVLSAAALWTAIRGRETGRPRWFLLAGLLSGFVLLTKCELAIALLPALAILLIPARLPQEPSPATTDEQDVEAAPKPISATTSACRVLAGMLTAIGLAVVLLSFRMDFRLAVQGALGSWKYLSNSELTGNPYYRAVMGTDDISGSLRSLYGWSVVSLGVLMFGWLLRNRTPRSLRNIALTSISFIAVFAAVTIQLDWLSAARPWPLILFVMLIGQLAILSKNPRSLNHFALCRLALTIWSLLLLLKIVLFCRVWHYGFSLAAPALAVLFVAGWDWWPNWVKRHGSSFGFARLAVGALACSAIGNWEAYNVRAVQSPHVSLGSGPNRIRADRQGALVKHLLQTIQQNVPENATLLCLPEGALVNVLSGHKTSTRFINFVPGDLLIFGEENMLADLQHSPPDWIVILNRDTSEYGAVSFTIDYAREIGDWIASHYEPVASYGKPGELNKSGYRLLQKHLILSE